MQGKALASREQPVIGKAAQDISGTLRNVPGMHHDSTADPTTQDMLSSQKCDIQSKCCRGHACASHTLKPIASTKQRLTIVRISESTVSVSCMQ